LGTAVLIACLLCWLPGSAQGQGVPPETRLKAIYLRKILNFVQWPARAIPAKNKAFQFCVEGDHLLGFALAQELRTITIDDRMVEVRWASKEQDLKGCQALFVGASEEKRFAKVPESVKGASVLTLGEADGFLDAGGVVQLSYVGNAVRFQINRAAARNAGLKMDARLLVLTQRVVNGSEGLGG
jgi:hypothetical protein